MIRAHLNHQRHSLINYRIQQPHWRLRAANVPKRIYLKQMLKNLNCNCICKVFNAYMLIIFAQLLPAKKHLVLVFMTLNISHVSSNTSTPHGAFAEMLWVYKEYFNLSRHGSCHVPTSPVHMWGCARTFDGGLLLGTRASAKLVYFCHAEMPKINRWYKNSNRFSFYKAWEWRMDEIQRFCFLC